MGAPVNHKRIKERYRPVPNRRERDHKERVRSLPCYGCGIHGISEAHHTMLHAPGKRWRRDHRFLVPVCPDCHRGTDGIHGIGSERIWNERNDRDCAAYAAELEAESVEMGILT